MHDFESDLTSLSATRNFSRRQMLATSLAVGFAAAVQPVCAQTAITTDANGLTAGEVKIPVADGEIPAYRAMPAKGGPFPLVVVVQEIFGVHEHIKDICRRLAKEGYVAIAAELYARQGSVAGMTDIQEIISKVVSKVPDAQVMSDLDAIVAYAEASGSADTARLGTAHKLLAQGYSPLPISPGTQACHISNWPRFSDAPPTALEIEDWSSRPDAGVGVATGGGLIAIDIDTDDERILEAIRTVIPASSVAKRGSKGRTDFYYDPSGAVPPRKFRGAAGEMIVEVLARGNQCVLPPTEHPKTGGRYHYLTDKTLEDSPLEELPALPVSFIESLQVVLAPWLPPKVTRPAVERRDGAFSANNRRMRSWAESALKGEASKVAMAPRGGRNNQLFSSSCALGRYVHTGVISESEAVDQLIESCRLNGLLIDDGMRQCIATVKSGLAKGVADALPNLDSNTTRGDQSSHVRSGHNPEYDTELEMGTAFAKESEDRLKFDHDLKSWFYWDGDVWQQDLGGYVFCLIQDFCTQHDGTRQKRFSSYCGVVNVEKFALNQPAVAVRQNVWDCDKFILGCRVGYVDLGSGEIIPPDPKYYVTKLASTVPKAGRPELWLSLLDYWTNGDAALTRFLQQMCGYLLTGDTSEQVLFFLRGPSATGKGTFSSVLQEILRDYVVSGDERLLAFAGSTSIDEALASARGARVYLFDELPRGFRINDALVKRISGQSRVTARQVYGRRFDYQPTYKILLLSNYDPKIPPDNDALKRRILVIPFERRAEKIDKALRERLRLEHPQILNWMIEGAADWQKNGLVLPNAVRITGDDYFDAHDTIAQFIDECCIVHPSAKEAAGALFEAWEAWAKRRGHPPGSETTFGTDLARRGYGKCWVRIEGAKTRGRSGIRLRKQSSTEPA